MEKRIVSVPARGSSRPSDIPSAQSLAHSLEDLEMNSPGEPSREIYSIYGGTASSLPAISDKPVNSARGSWQPAAAPPPATPTNPGNWSPSLQTVLDQPPSSLPYRLILGGLAFCVAFAAWATLGKIDEVGRARGQLVPEGDVYKIHPIDSGKIAAIRVKEGQAVKAGQVLLELNTEIATAEVDRLQKTLAADRHQLEQVQSLIETTKAEGDTRAEIADASARAQEVAIAQAKAQAQAQSHAIAQARAKAETTQKLLVQLREDEKAYQKRMERFKPLAEEGAIASEQVFQAEQALRERQRSITQNIGELQQALTESKRLQAELQQARGESDRLQEGLNQKQAEGRTTQIQSQQKLEQLQVQMTQLKAKIAQTQNLLTEAKAKLKQRFLYAPVAGTVSSLNIPNPGEVVQPAQTLAEIAPQDAPFVLSAKLPIQEAGFVKTGMPVGVKFDAYPYQDYGIVTGKVTSISPDTKPDKQLGEVYQVEVALDRGYVRGDRQTVRLKAGETGTAEIVIRRRRIIDILLDPIKQLQKGGINL